MKTWVGWEVHLTERIETRQFIFIFDEVKLQLKKKKKKRNNPKPCSNPKSISQIKHSKAPLAIATHLQELCLENHTSGSLKVMSEFD